jgi:hypothetical protein
VAGAAGVCAASRDPAPLARHAAIRNTRTSGRYLSRGILMAIGSTYEPVPARQETRCKRVTDGN